MSQYSRGAKAGATPMAPVGDTDNGPPPDMKKRALLFDSMRTIVGRGFSNYHNSFNDMNARGTHIYSWGAGYHGQLGRKFTRGHKKYATVPRAVEMDIAVRQVACGGGHTAAVTDAGEVYTWGDARSHQLGYQPTGFTNQPTPRRVDALHNSVVATLVACGQSHTAVITEKGNLITWGVSKFGQCGSGDRQPVKTPKKVVPPVSDLRFVDVSCGDKHTVALTTGGEVYAWGCGEHGQLGHGDHQDHLKMARVEALAGVRIVSVVCGSTHTCCLSDDGELFAFGFGEHLYPNGNQNFFYSPVKIPFKEPIVQVACGQAHIIALTAQGDVYTWGSGGFGQLGHGVKGNMTSPRLVLVGKQIAQVAAGRYHSLAVTNFGVLYSWGCGENGQLGHNSDENMMFPRVVEPNLGSVVGQISCGEHHTAVLTSTPWTQIHAGLEEWLHCEREELALKKDYLKLTNHGLFKKDLLKLKDVMDAKKQEWAEEKRAARRTEQEDMQRDVAMVRTWDSMLEEVKENPESAREIAEDVWVPKSLPSFLPAGQQPQARGSIRGVPGSPLRPEPQEQQHHHPHKPRSQQHRKQPSYQRQGQHKTLAPLGQTVNAPPGADSTKCSAARALFLKESTAMVGRMKAVIEHTGEVSNDAQLRKTLKSVNAMRKEYDQMRAETHRKLRLLEYVKRSAEQIRRTRAASNEYAEYHESKVKELEMKLNTVQIKITETDDNRRNYAVNIAHLKEEELERFYQLEALRQSCAENDAFCRKMQELQLQALEDKDRAEQELAQFQSEIAVFQSFVTDQLDKFQQLGVIARCRRERRELSKQRRLATHNEKVAARVEKLTFEMEEKDTEALAMTQQLEGVNERLRYFEKRFQQIANATGLTNPDAIINKFALKEEIKDELSVEIKKKQAAIQSLAAKVEALEHDRDAARVTFQQNSWKDVTRASETLRFAADKVDKGQTEAGWTFSKLTYFQEGLHQLVGSLPYDIPGARDVHEDDMRNPREWGEQKVLEILAITEEKLGAMQDVTAARDRERRLHKELEEARERERENESRSQRTSSLFSLNRVQQAVA